MRPRAFAGSVSIHTSGTRSLLLRSAAERFAAAGYAGVTIDQVAEGAGFTKGAFYVHFPDKESALLAVFEEWAGKVSRRIRSLAGHILDGAPLESALAAFLQDAVADGEASALEFELRSQAARLPLLRARLGAVERSWMEYLARACGPGPAADILRLRSGLVASAAVHGRPDADSAARLAAELLAPRSLRAARPRR